MLREVRRAALFAVLAAFSATGFAESGHSEHGGGGPACEGFGPQTPRDIDSKKGTNPQIFSVAPGYKKMNLCNIHFHNNAEHKAKDFAIYAGEGDHGHGGGYQCGMSKKLSKKELEPTKDEVCKGLKPGDTI
ncbi:MAG: delta-class carbonic anhydrase, partial [Gammaproteobacteria bacterium]|nr:delta-class carbonic anhydrase [Gammaproteobacteria bacterium]